MKEKKELKRWIKNKVKFTQALLVAFLITGGIAYAVDIDLPNNTYILKSSKSLVKVNLDGVNELKALKVDLKFDDVKEGLVFRNTDTANKKYIFINNGEGEGVFYDLQTDVFMKDMEKDGMYSIIDQGDFANIVGLEKMENGVYAGRLESNHWGTRIPLTYEKTVLKVQDVVENGANTNSITSGLSDKLLTNSVSTTITTTNPGGVISNVVPGSNVARIRRARAVSDDTLITTYKVDVDLNSANFHYKGNGDSTSKVTTLTTGISFLGEKKDASETSGENIWVESNSDGVLKIKMAKNPIFSGAKIAGVSFSNSFINANNKKIIFLQGGEIAEGSTAAVNGGQLWGVREIAETGKNTAEEAKVSARFAEGAANTAISKATANENDIQKNKKEIAGNIARIVDHTATLEKHTTSIDKNTRNIAKGFSFTADAPAVTGESDTVKRALGDSLVIAGDGKNLSTSIGKYAKVIVSLKESPKFGAVTINDAGKITGLSEGTADTDAINLSQLKPIATAVNAMIGADGSVSSPRYTLGTTQYNTIQDVFNDIHTKASGSIKFIDGDSRSKVIALGDTIQFKGSSSNLKVTLDSITGSYSFSIIDSPIFNGVVTANGFNANAQKITNVLTGTEYADAVNYGQLKDEISEVYKKAETYSKKEIDTLMKGIGENLNVNTFLDNYLKKDGSNLDVASKIAITTNLNEGADISSPTGTLVTDTNVKKHLDANYTNNTALTTKLDTLKTEINNTTDSKITENNKNYYNKTEVDEKLTKVTVKTEADVTSTTLEITNGKDRLIGMEDLVIDIKDKAITEAKISKELKDKIKDKYTKEEANTKFVDKTSLNTSLEKKANMNGDNIVTKKDKEDFRNNIEVYSKTEVETKLNNIKVGAVDLSGKVSEKEEKGVKGKVIHKHLKENYVNKQELKIRDGAIVSNYEEIQANKQVIASNAQRIEQVNKKVNKTAALAQATANLDFGQVRVGKVVVGAGVGNYMSETGVAVGIAYRPTEAVFMTAKWSGLAGEPRYNSYGASISYQVN